jgi:hypothetical protein
MKAKKYRIGELCRMVKGTSPTLKTEPGPYPLVVTAGYRRTADSWQLEGPAVCIPLVSSTGHGDAALHRVHYQEGKFALANLLVALLPNAPSVCDAKYLYHLFMTQKDELLVPLMQGTANVSLKEQDIAGVEIPLPPLAEQRRLVARIEELGAQIHEARTLRHQAVEEADALIASNRAKLISETTEQESLFDSLVEQLRGSSGLPLKEYQQSGRYPVIDQGQQFIGGFCDDESRLLHIKTPVVVWGDHTTNVKLVDFDFVPGADGTKVFQPKESIIAPFLFQVLKSVEYPEMGYSRHYRFLKDLPVKIPPLAEQRRIVAELDALQAEVDALKRLQTDTAAELDALLPSILDRAFKGEL